MARRYFGDVRRVEFTGEVVVTDPAPVVAFVGSLGAWRPETTHDAVLDGIRHRVADAIARDGDFRFRTRIGILVCR